MCGEGVKAYSLNCKEELLEIAHFYQLPLAQQGPHFEQKPSLKGIGLCSLGEVAQICHQLPQGDIVQDLYYSPTLQSCLDLTVKLLGCIAD